MWSCQLIYKQKSLPFSKGHAQTLAVKSQLQTKFTKHETRLFSRQIIDLSLFLRLADALCLYTLKSRLWISKLKKASQKINENLVLSLNFRFSLDSQLDCLPKNKERLWWKLEYFAKLYLFATDAVKNVAWRQEQIEIEWKTTHDVWQTVKFCLCF